MILEVIADSCADSIRLLPFLFFTYLVMEYLEHRAGERMQDVIRKSGKAGPAIGGLFGGGIESICRQDHKSGNADGSFLIDFR